MHNVAMHGHTLHAQHAVQNTARLIRVIRHILIVGRFNRKIRQQSIAVVTMVVDSIHAIGRVLRIVGQKFMLALRRPALGMAQGQQIMATLHFLQENHISSKRRQALL